MARIDAHELTDITSLLAEMGTKWEGLAKQGLYEGRAVMKDALEKEIDSLPTTPSNRFYFKGELPIPTLRPAEKKGLKEGLRIFKMESRKDGVSVTIGFTGYTDLGRGKQVPIRLIARSLEKGTTVVRPNRFVKRAYNQNKKEAEKVIVYTIEGKFKKYYTSNKR